MFSRNPLSRSPFSRTIFRFDPALPLMLFEGDGGGAGGKEPPPVPPKPQVTQADIDARIAELLGSKRADNDPMAALAIAIRQSVALQTRAEKAEAERDQFKANSLDDATKAELEAYRAKGKPEEFDTFKTRAELADKLEREKVVSKAARVLKMDAEDPLFISLLGNLNFEVEGEGDAAQVKVKDGDKVLSFDDFAKTRPEIERVTALLTTEPQQQQAPMRGVVFPKGAPSGGGKATSLAEQIRAEEAAKKAPQGAQQATPAQTLEQRMNMTA